MKILHVVASIDPKSGGVTQAIISMIEELQRMKIQNEIASLDTYSPDFSSQGNIKVHFFGPTLSLWKYSSKLKLWLVHNLIHYDAVIVHGLWLYHVYAVRKAQIYLTNKRKHVPTAFLMPHGMLDPWFQKDKGRRFKALRNLIFWKIIESKNISAADCVLFTCETEMLLAKHTFNNYLPKLEKVVGIGVQPPPVYSEKMNSAFYEKCNKVNDKSFILFIGRIDKKKGVDVLLKAYLNLLISGYSLPLLVIAGPGIETTYGIEMKNFVDKNETLKKYVSFPGMLTDDAKWGAFYLADAFILPSHQENFGIAVVEALACGLPVLISNQINIWREIDHDKCGLVSDDTIAGVEKNLKSWLNISGNQKMQMRKAATATYEKNFTSRSAVYKFLKCFVNN